MITDTDKEQTAQTDLEKDSDAADKEQKKAKKKRFRFIKPLIVVIVCCFCVYAIGDIASQQSQIEELKQETEAMSEKISDTKQLNDEYTEMLNADEAEFMEQVAVEQLGYAYPNERRFYIINRSED